MFHQAQVKTIHGGVEVVIVQRNRECLSNLTLGFVPGSGLCHPKCGYDAIGREEEIIGSHAYLPVHRNGKGVDALSLFLDQRLIGCGALA